MLLFKYKLLNILSFGAAYYAVLLSLWMTFESVDDMLKCDNSNDSYCFLLVLFITCMLYKMVLTFESVSEILKCDHSNESYRAVLSCGTVYYAVQDGSNF